MSYKRVVAVLIACIALAGGGAFAMTQTQETAEQDERERALGLDPSRDYPESFIRTAERYAEQYPNSEPGPPIGPDEVHIPDVEAPAEQVRRCVELASTDPTLESDSLCRAILLLHADAVEPGVHKVTEVKQLYLDFIRSDRRISDRDRNAAGG